MLDDFREEIEDTAEVKKHNNAVKFQYDDMEFSIRPLSYKPFQKRFDMLMKPYKRNASAGKVSEQKCTEILARAVSEKLLDGWKNMRISEIVVKSDFTEFKGKADKDGGVTIPFSIKNAFTILSHPFFKRYLLWIKDMADDEHAYIVTEEKENAKN